MVALHKKIFQVLVHNGVRCKSCFHHLGMVGDKLFIGLHLRMLAVLSNSKKASSLFHCNEVVPIVIP